MIKSPFPGMDPYLEQAWRDVHQRLCVYACDDLQGQIASAGLLARIDERLVVEQPEAIPRSIYPDIRVVERQAGSPSGMVSVAAGVALAERVSIADEATEEAFIQILDARAGGRVITAIEFLSLTNKLTGVSRDQYLSKQKELRNAGVSMVEIDLLRAGKPIVEVPTWRVAPERRTPYYAVVRRSWEPRQYDYCLLPLRERLLGIQIPLRQDEPEAVLNLQSLIDRVYQNGSYGLELNYTQAAIPPLESDDARWAEGLIRASVARAEA